MTRTLYERLGSTEGITKITSDLLDNHLKNPKISARYSGSDIPALKRKAAEFFIAGSGGPPVYAGKDLLDAHRHMNISDGEYMAMVDDAMDALDASGVGDDSKAEVLFIFHSLRPQVVGV